MDTLAHHQHEVFISGGLEFVSSMLGNSAGTILSNGALMVIYPVKIHLQQIQVDEGPLRESFPTII